MMSSAADPCSMTADRIYELQVVQNPVRARMCGFGEKDRRPMDPPPMVKLIIKRPDGTIEDVSGIDISSFVVLADIWSADKSSPCTLVVNPSSIPQPPPSATSIQTMGGDSAVSVMSMSVPTSTRNLMGSLVSSAYLLQGLDGEPGIYFIFQDLSVRSDGVFTLKFSIALLFDPLNPEKTLICAEVFSEPFTIYSAKRFPGMTESTKLSKCFAKQGIKIPIRKEARVRRLQNDPSDQGKAGSTTSSSSSSGTKNQETGDGGDNDDGGKFEDEDDVEYDEYEEDEDMT